MELFTSARLGAGVDDGLAFILPALQKTHDLRHAPRQTLNLCLVVRRPHQSLHTIISRLKQVAMLLPDLL